MSICSFMPASSISQTSSLSGCARNNSALRLGSWKPSPCSQHWERGRQGGRVGFLGVATLPQDCVDEGKCPVV